MKIKVRTGICVAAFLSAAVPGRAQSSGNDERGLWDVWCAGTNSAFQAAEVADACRAFKAKSPNDSLAVVVTGFEAWNCLKRGDTASAAKLFDSMLVEGRVTVLQKAGDEMARSWLSRLDRERVRAALKKVYIQNVEFPESLDAVKALEMETLPPLTDRWGKPWDYRRGSSIKGMETQRYVLESTVLGVYSDIGKALEIPYGERIDLKPVQLSRSTANAVDFRSGTGRTTVRKLGDWSARVSLVYMGTYIIVLTDGNHWSVQPKPR